VRAWPVSSTCQTVTVSAHTTRLRQHLAWRRRRVAQARRSVVLGPHTPTRSVWICSWQRSGSTWLAELLARAQHTRLIYEPANEPERLYTGEDAARTPLPTAAGAASRSVVAALAGSGHSPWLDQLNATTLARRSVVKDVRGLAIAGIVAAASPAPIVLLVRHPFAVARSAVALGWTDPSLSPAAAFVAEVQSWCDHHRAAAADPRLARAYLASYEELVAAPQSALADLEQWLAAQHPTWRVLARVPRHTDARSATDFRGPTTTAPSFADLDPAWREAGLAVLAATGLDALYGEAPTIADHWRDAWRAIPSAPWN
jgi:Sulfotransferase family